MLALDPMLQVVLVPVVILVAGVCTLRTSLQLCHRKIAGELDERR